MSENLESIVQENEAREQKAPTRNATNANPTNETEEEILKLKRSEELDDMRHSVSNTSLLNERYSEVVRFFFARSWFYCILFVLFVLFMASDKDIVMFFECIQDPWRGFIVTLAHKLLFVFGMVFLALLSFPTAKGLRRLFKSIIDRIAKASKSD